MSAPTGSRGSRSSTRSRGSIRGAPRGRGVRNGAGQQQVGRDSGSSATRGSSPNRHLKPPGQQNHIRNESWRPTTSAAQLSSDILSHAGTISKSRDQPWRNAADQDSGSYKQRMNDLYQTLKESRERERKKAIKDGFLADPDKPTSLANAITPVGTCQDMCPEFERVERIVQLMVDTNEKISSSTRGSKVPCEELMVKRFRRSAAGYDEQLPSDIRPPKILQKTLNHLFDSIIGGPEPLANTHKFVWDRTRGIRNDFSIQQVTKVEDLRIAIDCFERIARFHILCLHQLSRPDAANGEFDHHQEREQLNNTLLSLMYYYDDSRHKLASPNEAEFRAYCVIFEIQDQRPDLEDRAQNWPGSILKDPRVKTALKLYAAAGNTTDEQGPLRPRTSFSTAQANTRGFFDLIQSNAVSYVMACVAEIYFNLVRGIALESIWKAYKGKRAGAVPVEDWLLEDLTYALGFDNNDQAWTFCEEHEFEILERKEDGQHYLNLGSVAGPDLKDNNPRRKQIFSRYLVEHKKLGRSLPAVINGVSVSDAQAQGLVHDFDAENGSVAGSESLFINGGSDEEREAPRSRSASPLPKGPTQTNGTAKLNTTASPVQPPLTFGTPSTKPNPFNPTQPSQSQSKPTSIQAPNPLAPREPPKFDFFPSSNETKTATAMEASPYSSSDISKISLFPSSIETKATTAGGTQFGSSDTPKFNFFPPSNETKPTATAEPSPSGSGNTPKFNFFPNAARIEEAQKPAVTSFAGGKRPANQGVFGKPSTPPPVEGLFATKSVLGQQPTSSNTPTFSFGTSPLFASKPPASESIQAQGKPVLGTQPGKPSEESKPPTLSFETSPMFAAAAKEVQNEATPLSIQPSTSTPLNFSFSNASTTQSLQPNPFVPASSLNKPTIDPPTNSSDLFLKPSAAAGPKPPAPSSLPHFNFQTPTDTASPPNSKEPQESSQATPTPLLPRPTFFPSQPAPRPQKAQSTLPAPAPITPSPSLLPITSEQAPTKVTIPKPPPHDPRPEALDKITDGLMFDDGGLLQQYIELTIQPIIQSAVAQYEDEESWKEAREHRAILLARKYSKFWKKNVWNLGLMRRGRDRRRSLARSMQSLARSTQQRQEELSRSSVLDVIGSRGGQPKHLTKSSMMPPPALPKSNRQSLPSDFKAEMGGAIQTPKQSKRKLDEADLTDERKVQQPRTSNHKRSSTVGDSAMSAPPHRHRRFRHDSSIDTTNLGDSPLLSSTLLHQARRAASNTKSDTTQTDYFRLKAMGIDPDTPTVPATKKRTLNSDKVNGISKVPRTRPNGVGIPPKTDLHHTLIPSQPKAEGNINTDDDEDAFFASIRTLRETLADSTSWFQSERQTLERSMTPRTQSKTASPSSTKTETGAERRLREIKERGHMPSRSEIRLRAMGDKALLPEGFWDGEGMGRSLIGKGKGREMKTKEEEEEEVEEEEEEEEEEEQEEPRHQMMPNGNPTPPPLARGFAALARQGYTMGAVNGFGQSNNGGGQQQQQQSGASADDAIEL